jgi:hypothetical protein
MKPLYQSPSKNIIVPNGKFEDNFADILNEIIKYLNQYFKDSSFTFENNTNDQKGVSVIVKPKDDASKKNLIISIEQVQKKYPNIQYDGNNLISIKSSDIKSTPTTTQTTTQKGEPNVYSVAAMKAMSGGLLGEKKLQEQINRIKKLL